ncbi:hypothetical protein VNI00_013504 [Paramarasmius palmivorus]|uniref:Uncharacterized protein n=1 Tax=Paramarasmius palmivorus TaxID=297713 RepID=A0AAW0BXL2_9AGAR
MAGSRSLSEVSLSEYVPSHPDAYPLDLVGCQKMIAQYREELHATRYFLHGSRGYSGADVIRMVRSLNDEIMQLSAMLASIVARYPLSSVQQVSDPEDAIQFPFLNDKWVGLLLGRDSDTQEIVIQCAIQAAMVFHVVLGIKAMALNEEENDILYRIYRRQDPSPIARQWRAITKMHAKYPVIDQVQAIINKRILHALHGIVQASGIVSDACMADIVVNGQGIVVVIEKAMEIDRILTLEMTMEDVTVFVAPLGEVLDLERMECAFRQEVLSKESFVIGSTDMGICCLPNANEASSWQIILKPKVVLDTTFT